MKVWLNNNAVVPVCLFKKGECFVTKDGKVFMVAETLHEPGRKYFIDLEKGYVREERDFIGITANYIEIEASEVTKK